MEINKNPTISNKIPPFSIILPAHQICRSIIMCVCVDKAVLDHQYLSSCCCCFCHACLFAMLALLIPNKSRKTKWCASNGVKVFRSQFVALINDYEIDLYNWKCRCNCHRRSIIKIITDIFMSVGEVIFVICDRFVRV